MQVDDIGVFIGIDVGKSEHWATALDRDGRRIHDRALPSDESRLRDLYKHLAEHGRVLVVVDQPATIGALAVAVAQDMGVTVGYLPGLSMRRIADLSPGNAKTDARDAAVIAQAARTMPHTLRAISTSDEDTAALGVLTGLDLDLARQVNQTANRIRGLYTQIHPALETVLGSLLEHDAILEAIAARRRPHRTEEGRQGTHRCQAEQARSPPPCRLGPAGLRCPGQADRDGGRH
jgi:transposase, IS111A/IS1328/IS1533 (fragment)